MAGEGASDSAGTALCRASAQVTHVFGTRNARDSGKVIPGGRADSVRRILTCAASWGEDGRSSWLTPAIVVRRLRAGLDASTAQ
jgi:hypothetical protein